MSDWKETTLGEVCDITSSKRIFAHEYCIRGVPFYRGKEIIEKQRGQSVSTELFISEERFNEISAKFGSPRCGDMLLTSVGTLGVPYVVKNERFYFKDGNLTWFHNYRGIDSAFLYYWIISPIGQNQIEARSIGSTQRALTIDGLSKFDITLPPLPTQRAIACILSSLDDKIDLLTRQTATLEALAQTYFRQWFVEEANEDWEESTLGDVITVKGGTTPSTKELIFWDGDIYWATPRDLAGQKSVFLFNTSRKITKAGLAQIGSGLLPVGSVLLSSRAPIGYLTITDVPVAINQGFIGIICNKVVPNYIMYLWCKENMELIINSGNGSVFQEISKSTFKTLHFFSPSKKVIAKLNEIIEPYFKKIRCNNAQILTLQKLRDTLLPKLISGEVRVKQQEEAHA